MNDSQPTFQFGPFEFDSQRQELRRRGHPVRLSAAQIRLLTLFLEHPRALVRREAITQRLWEEPNAVDVEAGINTAVNRLRANLGDDPATPKYIETVVGLGYKFLPDLHVLQNGPRTGQRDTSVGPVVMAASTAPAETGELALPQTVLRRMWVPAAVALAGIATILVTGVALRRHAASIPKETPPQAQAPPLVEKAVTTYSDATKVLTSAMSPDGKRIAYWNGTAITVIWPETRISTAVPVPAALDVKRLAWFPDQQRLAASGTDRSNGPSEVWLLSLTGEPPQLLLKDADLAVLSGDGRRIAFLRNSGHEIWTASADGQQPQRLLSVTDPESFAFLLWSADGRWLFAEHLRPGNAAGATTPGRRPGSLSDDTNDTRLWEKDLIDANSGRIADRQFDQRLESGLLLSDGRLFSVAPVSDLDFRLMMQHLDLDSGRFLDTPSAVKSFARGSVMNLSGSADGRSFSAIETRRAPTVIVASLRWPGPALEGTRKITRTSLGSYPHSWDPAGDAVVIENSNLDYTAIYLQKTDGSAPKLIAELPTDAAMGEFTPDGRWVLFLAFPKNPSRPYGVFRVPATGGTPEQLNVPGAIDEFHCSISTAGRCVVRESLGTSEFVYYALDPVKGQGTELGRTPWQPSVLGDWSISPSGTTAAVANHDASHPSVQLVDLRKTPASVTELPVKGYGMVLEPIWSADGQGLYVETQTESGYALLYLKLTGAVTLLRESTDATWGVPSRDGKKIAYPGIEENTNLWTGTF